MQMFLNWVGTSSKSRRWNAGKLATKCVLNELDPEQNNGLDANQCSTINGWHPY